jgi:nucleoside-diphosphate-sugar epimerase
MNILITGASGFIGRNLIRRLSCSHNIFALARHGLSCFEDINVTCIQADLSEGILPINMPTNIDSVIHLAQSCMYRQFPLGAKDMLAVNVQSTATLLEWARHIGISHFILASTASVYAQCSQILKETSRVNADSFYAATKISAEQLSAQYSEFFSVDILRLFTVYGPDQSDMLIPRIMQRLTSGSEISLASGIGLYLSPIFIDDVVHCIAEILRHETRSKASPLRVLNICSHEVLGLRQIVSILAEYLGCTPNIVETSEDTRFLVGDNSLISSILGVFGFTEFSYGAKRVADAFVGLQSDFREKS